MDDVGLLQRQYTEYLISLYCEGILDASRFNQLQNLQNEDNSDFVLGQASGFFQDIEETLNNAALALMPKEGADFQKLSSCLNKLKLAASSSLGARKVKSACIIFQSFCEAQNHDECLKCLRQVAEECIELNNKLQTLFKMETMILAAGGRIPIV